MKSARIYKAANGYTVIPDFPEGRHASTPLEGQYVFDTLDKMILFLRKQFEGESNEILEHKVSEM